MERTGNAMLCPKCEKEIPETARFCRYCGSPVTVRRSRRIIKIIVSFLLFIIFTAGAVVSGGFVRQIREQRNTPYRQEQVEELENTLDRLANSSEEQLHELESQFQDALDEQNLLKTRLYDLENQRRREILQAAMTDSDKITEALFSTDYFTDAYRQYLEDLLDVFLKDERIHEWLYPYYAYSMELGKNPYIADELYFYTSADGDSIFSEETQDPETLLINAYNYDLYEHIYYTGRIYITASDFMNRVLLVPDYVANGAVFVKAFGGNPDPENMYVPGWRTADYAEFWRDAPDYSDSREPIWWYYRLTAEELNLDWEQLADEQAYYDAYLKFMDSIAPGLGVFDMVTYSAGDDAFGGMYYDITGKEASVTEIVTLYIEEHPEYWDEIDLDPDTLPSSFDQELAETKTELDALTEQASNLADKRNELAALLDSEDEIREKYERLMTDVQNHNHQLLQSLVLFIGSFVLLCFMTVISLVAFMILIIKSCTRINEPTAPAGPHT